MVLNQTLRLIVDNAHAKYAANTGIREPLSASEQLTLLGLRKATKKELLAILVIALAEEAAA